MQNHNEIIRHLTDPFLSTGISNGVSPQGFYYEIHLPFKITHDCEIFESIPDIQIITTNPATQETRQIFYSLMILPPATGAEIKEELHLVEETLSHQGEDAHSPYQEIFALLALASKKPRTFRKRKQLIEQFKRGNIYLINGELSLLANQVACTDPIMEQNILKAQNLLSGKFSEERPQIFFYTKDYVAATCHCNLFSQQVLIREMPYLELNLTATFHQKPLTFTTRILSKKNEEKEQMIHRIGKDGSLERVFLLTQSAFTCQVAL